MNRIICITLFLRLAAAAPSSASSPPPAPSGYAGMLFNGSPAGVPASTDCVIRKAAWDYAKKLQPQKQGFKQVYDALQLQNCGVPAPRSNLDAVTHEEVMVPSMLNTPLPATGEHILYVNPPSLEGGGHAMGGDADADADANAEPLAYSTIAEAVVAARALLRASPAIPVTVALRAGVHYITDGPIQLGPADAGLTIRNMPGEAASVSGAKNITTVWKKSTAAACKKHGCWECSLKGQVTNVGGLRRNGVREIRARYPNFDPELNAVINGTYMWHDGRQGLMNITTYPTTWIQSGAVGMNGIPIWPPTEAAVTHVIDSKDWPSVDWPMSIMFNGSAQKDSWSGEGSWGQHWLGVGGTCADRSPPAGYWCAPGAPRRISVPNHPSGIVLNKTQLPNMPYKAVEGAVLHAWGKGHWYSNIFEIGSQVNETDFMFSRGGTQGGEGETVGEEWYIENVLEELDIGREWYFDNKTMTLYYLPNTTAAAPPTGDFTATQEMALFNVTGTQKDPAHHIAIQGLTLRDTTYSYFEPHGLPSGGDWALAKRAAIILVGTKDIDIVGNVLTRMDGNAIFVGGYNRNLTIGNNEFFGLGGSAMASWGDTSYNMTEDGKLSVPYPIGPDGRQGNQPRGCQIVGNIVSEVGMWEKQSSAWFQAVTAQTNISGNVFYNGPRAAINVNDGFGGGDDISTNLIFNMVRESKDHGPYNSWDRVPYITTLRNGTPSIVPADKHIHNNFIVGTYNSQECIDTDDGSAYIQTYDNVFAYGAGGLKSDFGGHDHRWRGNVVGYVLECFGAPMPFRYFHGFNDAFVENKCVTIGPGLVPSSGPYTSDCYLSSSWNVSANQVYTVDGQLEVCGKAWADWVKTSKDTLTTVSKWPSDTTLVQWAKDLLGDF